MRMPPAWTLEPGVLLGLLGSGSLYLCGLARLWRQGQRQGVREWEVACFCAGWLVLALALVSPLHALGGALLSAHMVQHELLMVVAAPLLVLGRPFVPMIWAFPASARHQVGRLAWWCHRSIRRTVALPSVAWALHAAAILSWHLPRLYQRSLLSETDHALQHASFLVTGLLFWWSLLRGRGARQHAGAAVLYLFVTAVYTGGLGALLTLSPGLWYPAYVGRTAAWGLTPLEDQQLAGLIMWMPGALVYLVAALSLTLRWLAESEVRVLRWERAR